MFNIQYNDGISVLPAMPYYQQQFLSNVFNYNFVITFLCV